MIKNLLILLAVSMHQVCFANFLENGNAPSVLTDEQRYQDGKIYINPEQLFLTENGIFFVISEKTCVQLPGVFSDDQGCYLVLSNSGLTDELRPMLKRCVDCGRPFIGICRNKECPRYGKNGDPGSK